MNKVIRLSGGQGDAEWRVDIYLEQYKIVFDNFDPGTGKPINEEVEYDLENCNFCQDIIWLLSIAKRLEILE